MLRKIEQGAKFDRSLGGDWYRLQRVIDIAGKLLVEIVVFFLRHLILGAKPDRLSRIDHILLRLGLAFLLLFGDQDDRIVDEVGILLDDLANAPAVEKLGGVFAE